MLHNSLKTNQLTLQVYNLINQLRKPLKGVTFQAGQPYAMLQHAHTGPNKSMSLWLSVRIVNLRYYRKNFD